jgi:hypothetical protein
MVSCYWRREFDRLDFPPKPAFQDRKVSPGIDSSCLLAVTVSQRIFFPAEPGVDHPVALLVLASLLLLVAGTNGSRAGSNDQQDGRFPCTAGTLRGTYGIQVHGTGPVPPPVGLAERDGDEVVNVSARLKDVVSSAAQLHGWNQPAGVNVNIANIPMPSEEERAEMRAVDAKLDAIAAKLKDTPFSRSET